MSKHNYVIAFIGVVVLLVVLVVQPTVCTISPKTGISAGMQNLMGLAQAMEQFYAENLTYSNSIDSLSPPSQYGYSPAIYKEIVVNGSLPVYRLSVMLDDDKAYYEIYAVYIGNSNDYVGHYLKYTADGRKYYWSEYFTDEQESWNRMNVFREHDGSFFEFIENMTNSFINW